MKNIFIKLVLSIAAFIIMSDACFTKAYAKPENNTSPDSWGVSLPGSSKVKAATDPNGCAGEPSNAAGSFALNNKTQCTPPPGANLSNAINMNEYNLISWESPVELGDFIQMDPSLCYGNDYGQPGDDIFHYFILNRPATVSFKIEGEGDGSDEITPACYLHLLDANGNLIESKFYPAHSYYESVQPFYRTLQPGKYYIVSEFKENVVGYLVPAIGVLSFPPAFFQVSGGGGYCPGASGVSVTLSGSEVGLSYTLGINGSYSSTPRDGTGSPLTWSNLVEEGTYTVVVMNISGATQYMTGGVTVNISPNPTTFSVGGGGTFRPGGNGLSISLSSSQAGIIYQLKINGANAANPISGNGNALTWTNQTVPGVYTVLATSAITGCGSQLMSGSATIAIDEGTPSEDPNTAIANYVKSTSISTEGILTDADISNAPAGAKHITYQYLDGLGRPIQQVDLQASPAGYDLVQFAVYDKYGNQPKGYLPYTSSSQDGRFQTNAIGAQLAFYNKAGDKIADDSKPFAISKFEDSPSGRLLEQGAPGADWQPGTGHTALSDFRFNTADDHVRIWTPEGPAGEYTADQLIVSKITDENGNHVLLFSDKLGRKILKRVLLEENITENGSSTLVNYLQTYLVYNDYGQVVYQVPPKAVAKINSGAIWNAAFINEWIFSYTYDVLGRLVQKKVPGSAPVYICYDKLDRPILVQDGKSRAQNKWFYVKYDQEERPVLEGIYTYADPGTAGATPQEKLQNYLNGLDFSPGSPLSFEERQAGTPHGYTSRTFPATGISVLSVHYYDDYDFNYDGTPDYSYVAQGLPGEKTNPQGSSFGNATGSKSLILGTSSWLVGYTFYDKYGQPIQSRGNNHLSLTADNLSTSVYSFDGNVQVTKAYHKAGPGKEVTVINKFEYDLKGRLKKVFQNNNSASSDQLIAQYEYNELGQLVDKKLHGTASGFLQSVDFRYNIRGWLTHINNSKLEVNATNDESNDLFGMEFLYNTTEAGLNDQAGDKQYWNGNLSAVKWQVKPDAASTQNTNPVRERSYKFTYDKVNRLRQATYQASSGTAWNAEVGGYNEAMTYDHNGNILTLTRNTLANGASAPTIADNLAYSYEAGLGNQLKKVEDASGNTTGFSNGANLADEYGYDENGNLSRDNNKGISQMVYNEANKISLINYADGRKISYIYEAGGTRLRKEVFQAGASTPSKTIDYAGSFVYENGSLSYFGMPEGRVRANGSSLTLEYCITDHQGNSRVSFEAYNNGTATVAKLVQENHYYPFGMSITGMAIRTATPSNPNKNLYNQGSELQDDFGDSPGTYSTGFREYDPVLGRFNAVDPLADYFADWTPYVYSYNDPVNYNDPTGLAGRDPKPGQSMTKPRKRHNTKSGGGDNSDNQFYDYSGMADQVTDIDLQYDESIDDEVENNEHINRDNNLAYEAFARWKGQQGGGDKGKKDPQKEKPKVNSGEDPNDGMRRIGPRTGDDSGDGMRHIGPRTGDNSGLGKKTFWDGMGDREVDGWIVDDEGYYTGRRAPICGSISIGPGSGSMKLLGTTGKSLLNIVKNPKLVNVVKDLFRSGAKIGSGSAMDAYRFEQITGALVGGKSHGQKLIIYRNALVKLWKNNKILSPQDKAIVKQLLTDIQNALSGQ